MVPITSTHNAQSPTVDIDFAALADFDPDFAQIYHRANGHLDFHDPATQQQLTKSLLRRDFHLTLDLAPDRLCPPVPIRFAYIRWLQDLLDTTTGDGCDAYDPSRQVVGVDVGVGASCIYALLGCAARPGWRFGGTEVDATSFEYAQRNVRANGLEARIRLRRMTLQDPLLDLAALGIRHADFVMCNPPFFADRDEMMATWAKGRPPPAVCTGAEVEMITDGGDVGFALRLLEESRELGERVTWYSSMLGKLQSVGTFVARLREIGVSNWAVTTLWGGNVTRRWAVAWSFGDLRPRNDVARTDISIHNVLPFPTEFRTVVSNRDTGSVSSSIDETLSGIDVDWTWDRSSLLGTCFAAKNVWSRAARRQRKLKVLGVPDSPAESESYEDEPGLGVQISIVFPQVQVVVRWLQGHDSVLYESFCGMLKRAITQSSSAGA